MPTAKQPTLESTQAIGAVLLHQFARQRFIEAGASEQWIHDAEERENLDHLTAILLQDEEENPDLLTETSSQSLKVQEEEVKNSKVQATDLGTNEAGSLSEGGDEQNTTMTMKPSSAFEEQLSSSSTAAMADSSSMGGDQSSLLQSPLLSSTSGLSSSINNTSSSSYITDTSTLTNSTSNHDNTTQGYVTMTGASSTTIMSNGHDSTIYHSINNGHNKSTNENSSIFTDYSRQRITSPKSSNNAKGNAATNIERLQATPMMAHYGKELRKIADEFEKSRLRKVVNQRANQIRLESISRESFMQLLEELFQGGVTRERIVILFFFCTDVALRAVSFGQELVVKLISWSFSYIIGTVCKIIHSIGGWEIELSSVNWQNMIFQQLPSILVSCCAALGIVALVSHLNKTLRA